MLNIIIKNKKLIKLYKYSIGIFKFLNKHLYILSFISLIAKFRKSFYYKMLTYLIKAIVAINLIITSGLFFTLTDFSTPLIQIWNIYDEILGPYIEILKQKIKSLYNLLINLDDNLITKYNNVSVPEVTKVVGENSDLIKKDFNVEFEEEEIKALKDAAKIVALYITIVGSLYYFIFVLPGSVPNNPEDWNFLNLILIDFKVGLKDLILYYFGNGGNPGTGGGDPSNVENIISAYEKGKGKASSIDSHSPSPFQTPVLTPVETANNNIIIHDPEATPRMPSLTMESSVPVVEETNNIPLIRVETTNIGVQTSIINSNVSIQTESMVNSVGVQTYENAIGITRMFNYLHLLDRTLRAEDKAQLLRILNEMENKITD